MTVERPLVEDDKVVTDKKGKTKPNSKLRDTEKIPLKDDIDAYLTKGAAHFKAGRYDDCTASLNEVVKREMNNAAAWYYKSTAEAIKGNLKLVVPFLTRSADIEEEFRERAKTDPSFDQVRDTPEFQVVVNK